MGTDAVRLLERQLAEAERRADEQAALVRAAKTLNASLDLEAVLARICEEAEAILAADTAVVYLRPAREQDALTVAATHGLPPEALGYRFAAGDGLAGRVLATGRPLLTTDYHRDCRVPAGSPFGDIRAAIGVPIRWDGDVRGVLSLGYRTQAPLTEEPLARLGEFAEIAAVACANASAHAGLAHTARTDGLTGCLNHAALHESLGREIERAVRHPGAVLSFVLLDLDDFKAVNEDHGHLVGDEVLRRAGRALRESSRTYDATARYGGDEFALVAVEVDEREAAEMAGRALDALAAALRGLEDVRIGRATAGVAAWEPGLSATELIARADRALLWGKQRGGRGQVLRWSTVSEEPGDAAPRSERTLPVPAAEQPAGAVWPPAREIDDRLRMRTRQLALANALGARIGAMTDADAIIDAAVDELHGAFGYFLVGAIKRRDDGEVFCAAGRGEAFERLLAQAWHQPESDGLIGLCLRENRPVLVNDVGAETTFVLTGETGATESELVVPVWVGDHLWGAINVEEDRRDAFDDDDVRLLSTLAGQVGAALRSAELYEQLEAAYLGTAEALAAALEAKDAYTAEHAASIVEQAAAVGRRLGMDESDLRDLRFGAAFHDIGKIAVPEAILNKPGPLTDEERIVMEGHTVAGEQILAPVAFLAGVRRLVRHEHERWDGRGYPDGLAGEAIPLGARVILACDALHAMTSDRPYRRAMSGAEALEELRRGAGTQFDPDVVAALLVELGAGGADGTDVGSNGARAAV